MNDLRNLLKGSSITERKSFIKSFVKEVVVTGNNAMLKYTIPLSKEGLREENLGVPHIVHFGGAKVTIGRTFSLSFSLAEQQQQLTDYKSSHHL